MQTHGVLVFVCERSDMCRKWLFYIIAAILLGLAAFICLFVLIKQAEFRLGAL